MLVVYNNFFFLHKNVQTVYLFWETCTYFFPDLINVKKFIICKSFHIFFLNFYFFIQFYLKIIKLKSSILIYQKYIEAKNLYQEISNYMSHLITGTLPLEGRPLIDMTKKYFINPDIKKIIKSRTSKTQANQLYPQQQIIDRLCFKLSGKQFLKLDQDNMQKYQKYKKRLKNKRKNTLQNGPQLFRIIQEIFTRQQDRTQKEKQLRRRKNQLNLAKYLQNMPQKIYLHQKYNNKINLRINTLEELKDVEKQKSTYRKWMNQSSNSPIKNPNFTKMTFLLEKLNAEGHALDDMMVKTSEKHFLQKDDNKENHQSLFKLLSKQKKFNKSHKKSKSGFVPNITLEPLGQASLNKKHNFHKRQLSNKDFQVVGHHP